MINHLSVHVQYNHLWGVAFMWQTLRMVHVGYPTSQIWVNHHLGVQHGTKTDQQKYNFNIPSGYD